MKPRRLLLVAGGLIVIVTLLGVGSALLPRLAGQADTPTPEPEPLAVVAVRARGEVVPAAWADLSFGTEGALETWLVDEGDVVEAGTPLARLDTATLELSLEDARQALETAELALTQAQAEHERQLGDAQLSLDVADARLVQTRAQFPSLDAAEVRLQAATEAEARARTEYDKAVHRYWEPDDVTEGYRLEHEAAIDARQLAQAEVDTVRAEQYASSQELLVLEKEVERSRIALAWLERGTDPLLAREVERARLVVMQAEADLEAATLVAPFDGTVVTCYLRPYDQAGSGVVAVALADLGALHIETTDLDEWGAAKIAAGSAAEVSFTAFDDKTLTGHVTEVALRGERLSSGDVVYRAVVELDVPDPDLRWGMTARLTFPLE